MKIRIVSSREEINSLGDVWGHRKDINEYYEIKPEKK